MRVIAGQYRSRRLFAPSGKATRPTSDRLRETLFNVIGPAVEKAHFADLFAGSGAVGIEALSRGAERCLFVEQAPTALAAIKKNLNTLGLQHGATVDGRSVKRALLAVAELHSAFDIIFLDPPYEAAVEYASTLEILSNYAPDLLAVGASIIAEHARRAVLPASIGHLKRSRLLEQGDAALSFYKLVPEKP